MSEINLRIMSWKIAVCKIAIEQVPIWASQSRFLSFTKTADEYSFVCEEKYVPGEIKSENGWSCIKVEGVLDFSLIGVISGIAQILSAEKISVFVISTYDTDYLLVKEEKMENAVRALKSGGYSFPSD